MLCWPYTLPVSFSGDCDVTVLHGFTRSFMTGMTQARKTHCFGLLSFTSCCYMSRKCSFCFLYVNFFFKNMSPCWYVSMFYLISSLHMYNTKTVLCSDLDRSIPGDVTSELVERPSISQRFGFRILFPIYSHEQILRVWSITWGFIHTRVVSFDRQRLCERRDQCIRSYHSNIPILQWCSTVQYMHIPI